MLLEIPLKENTIRIKLVEAGGGVFFPKNKEAFFLLQKYSNIWLRRNKNVKEEIYQAKLEKRRRKWIDTLTEIKEEDIFEIETKYCDDYVRILILKNKFQRINKLIGDADNYYDDFQIKLEDEENFNFNNQRQSSNDKQDNFINLYNEEEFQNIVKKFLKMC